MQPKGTTLNGIEALQWAMMRDLFHEAIDLKVVQSTSGIVKA
jgi:pyrroline-5-carboxylate reductase